MVPRNEEPIKRINVLHNLIFQRTFALHLQQMHIQVQTQNKKTYAKLHSREPREQVQQLT